MLPALVAKRKMHIPMVIVFQAGTHMYRTVSFSRIFRSYRRKYRIDATLFSTLRDRFRIEFARRCVDTSIAVNEVIAKSLENGGFPPGRIAVNGNGVDFDFLKSIPEEEKKYDACYVSAITASKGVFDLVEVWRRILYEWKRDLRLIIIGMGSKAEIAQLKDIIVQFNLEDAIEIAGFIPDQTEVFRRIKQSKLFILPTYGESWCLAITEAMALGTPVITYDLPIFKAIYPQGIIRVPTGNLEMLERNILSALSDEEYLEKIRSEAESNVKRYDWAAVAKREREILSRVAE